MQVDNTLNSIMQLSNQLEKSASELAKLNKTSEQNKPIALLHKHF